MTIIKISWRIPHRGHQGQKTWHSQSLESLSHVLTTLILENWNDNLSCSQLITRWENTQFDSDFKVFGSWKCPWEGHKFSCSKITMLWMWRLPHQWHFWQIYEILDYICQVYNDINTHRTTTTSSRRRRRMWTWHVT